MKERSSKILDQTAFEVYEDKMGKGDRFRPLTATSRLALLKQILTAQKSAQESEGGIVLPIKNASENSIRELVGGHEFDSLCVDIAENKAEKHFEITIQTVNGDDLAPRVLTCHVQQNGAPISIAESDVDHRLVSGQRVEAGGEAQVFEFVPEEPPSDERKTVLTHFDGLLQLAAKATEISGAPKRG